MVNAALLEETISHIKSHPELHYQSGYYEVCEFGVAACFAGRALLLAGYEPALVENLGAVSSMARNPITNETVSVWDEARRVLGITGEWAVNLFTSVNTRQMLENKVKDLLNGSELDRYHDLIPHSL